jgi:hypothetical protein
MSTNVAPIVERQINQYLFVGGTGVRTIQQAVTFAVEGGGDFAVIIPVGYAGSDTIAAVTGGDDSVYLCDQRTPSWQCYAWNGTAYIPASLGDILCGSIPTQQLAIASYDALPESPIPTVLSDGESLFLSPGPEGVVFLNWQNGGHGVAFGDGSGEDGEGVAAIDKAGNAVFNGCEVAGSPVRTFANTPDDPTVYPPAGVPVSTGTGWDTSINPNAIPLTTQPNTFQGTQTIEAGGLTFPSPNVAIYMPAGDVAARNIGASGDLTAATAVVAGSPVRTMANTPNATFPPAGVPVSTGTAWDTSIPTAAVALTTQPNTFQGTQTIQGGGLSIPAANVSIYMPAGDVAARNIGASGDLTATGNIVGQADVIGGGLTISQGPTSSPGTSSIRTLPGAGVTFSPDGAASSVFLNWDRGTGVAFGNGNQSQVAAIDNTGALKCRAIDSSLPDYALFIGAIATNGIAFGSTQTITMDNFGSLQCVGFTAYTGDFNTLNATSKNFKITNPIDSAQWLVHGSLEGPEYGVYYRGEAVTDSDGNAEIVLPDYFEALVMATGRTIMLTQIFDDDTDDFAQLMAGRIVAGKFRVRSSDPAIKFCWMVNAVRADIPPLVVVQPKDLKDQDAPAQPVTAPPPQPRGKRRV